MKITTEYIVEYPNVISEFICDDIIDFFQEEDTHEIPKDHENYKKIEKLLYTQLLMKIQDYKSRLINYPTTDEKNKITDSLNQKLYTKSFIVKKYADQPIIHDFNPDNYNRYNCLTYIFFLDDSAGTIEFDGIKIKPNIGSLILFPTNNDYKYIVTPNETTYILSGQLCYNNIC